MKKNFLQSYTSDTSMISSGIFFTLVGVFTHQIGWILLEFLFPLSTSVRGFILARKGKRIKSFLMGC